MTRTIVRVAVLDYGIGNLRSAQKGLEAVGADAKLVTSPADVAAADAVVLPGVGAFGACMSALERTGLDQVALDAASSGQPFVGICVGMQLMFDSSVESPGVAGLGILKGDVERIDAPGLPVPHMQWNDLDIATPHPLFEGLAGEWMYFVHSYAVTSDNPAVVARTRYGGPVAAGAADGNVAATQFHPEKSGRSGLRLLDNLCRWAAANRS